MKIEEWVHGKVWCLVSTKNHKLESTYRSKSGLKLKRATLRKIGYAMHIIAKVKEYFFSLSSHKFIKVYSYSKINCWKLLLEGAKSGIGWSSAMSGYYA